MDAKNAVESHMRAAERATMNAFAPLSEMMNQSRTLFEKSVAAMREETLELLNRMHERNGAMLADVRGGSVAQWATAHEKWFSDFSREMFDASMRFHETARHLMADSIEGVSHSLRNGKIAEAAKDTAAHAAEAAQSGAAAMREAARFPYHDAPAATHPEYNA
jgi:hypothetical protein